MGVENILWATIFPYGKIITAYVRDPDRKTTYNYETHAILEKDGVNDVVCSSVHRDINDAAKDHGEFIQNFLFKNELKVQRGRIIQEYKRL